jgi:hypothetical protein
VAVVTPPPQVVAPQVVTPPAAVAVANTAAVTSDDCTDLVKLEPSAMMGSLRVGQVKCLDGRVNAESAQTTKDKLSRLLIINAEASGNKSEWEKYVRRHLEDIDRSDPDLCFKYASHLAKGGARSASATIKCASAGSKLSTTAAKLRQAGKITMFPAIKPQKPGMSVLSASGRVLSE